MRGEGLPRTAPTYLEKRGANESEGRQVQTKLARKKFHRMSVGSGAHSPDLMVLSKENTPPVLTAVQARNICQSGHLIAFNRKYNVTLSMFSTWESDSLSHLI